MYGKSLRTLTLSTAALTLVFGATLAEAGGFGSGHSSSNRSSSSNSFKASNFSNSMKSSDLKYSTDKTTSQKLSGFVSKSNGDSKNFQLLKNSNKPSDKLSLKKMDKNSDKFSKNDKQFKIQKDKNFDKKFDKKCFKNNCWWDNFCFYNHCWDYGWCGYPCWNNYCYTTPCYITDTIYAPMNPVGAPATDTQIETPVIPPLDPSADSNTIPVDSKIRLVGDHETVDRDTQGSAEQEKSSVPQIPITMVLPLGPGSPKYLIGKMQERLVEMELLAEQPSGEYTPATHAAVVKFQKEKLENEKVRLGVVDLTTWNALGRPL